MLNMQNVKDIEITEGKVRTIHDKDNRLIWGRLAYDTKYAGDTTQATTTGKNLLEGTPWRTVVTSSGYPAYIGTGITINLSDNNNIDFTSTENYRGVESNYIQIANGTTITVSFTGTLPNRLYVTQYDSNKTRVSTLNPSVTTVGTVTVTATQDGYVTVAFANSTSGSFAISNIQMEVGSSATSYEPYTGGIPAPNPDYPQSVQVVTGEQTVTIGDGVESEDFTISLGTVELCKIGTYQDYIYKSGDDWYVHKEVGKAIFNGTESWSGGTSTGSPTYLYAYTAGLDSLNLYSARQAFCSHFTIAPNQLATATEVSYPCMSVVTPSAETYAHIRLMIPLTIAATTSALRTWLGSHNTNLYYVLVIPTDTKITDSTLLGQLEAVHEWLTRYGYSSTVTGTLPIIINQTNL